MGIGMRHVLVGQLGRGIESQGVGGALPHRLGQRAVGAEHRAGGGEDQIVHPDRPAPFEDIQETQDVGGDIGQGVFEAVANAGLGGEVDHPLRAEGGEQRRDGVDVLERDAGVFEIREFGQPGQARLFEVHVIVGVEIVQADDDISPLQQPVGYVRSDEARRACNENPRHLVLSRRL